jgi:hypothetical protein
MLIHSPTLRFFKPFFVSTIHFNLLHRAVQLLMSNLPAIKELAMELADVVLELVDVVFVPKMIAKQLTLAVALQTGMVRVIASRFTSCGVMFFVLHICSLKVSIHNGGFLLHRPSTKTTTYIFRLTHLILSALL